VGARGLAGPKGWGRGRLGFFEFFFNSEISNPFLFYFLLWIYIQTCHKFKFKYSKHVHQTKDQSRLSMMQHFMSPIGFNTLEEIVHLSHKNLESIKRKRKGIYRDEKSSNT
jgi:hypothetical protein